MTNPPDRPCYLTPYQVSLRHPAFTEQAVRRLVHNAEINGLSPWIKRANRRVLIDIHGFERWLDLFGATQAKQEAA